LIKLCSIKNVSNSASVFKKKKISASLSLTASNICIVTILCILENELKVQNILSFY
jgi:hypothetical protein